jgi:hypothetical protein
MANGKKGPPLPLINPFSCLTVAFLSFYIYMCVSPLPFSFLCQLADVFKASFLKDFTKQRLNNYSPSGLQAVPLALEVDGYAVVVLDGGLVADDLGEEIHFSVLLCQLEGLVDAVREDQELDGGVEVAELEEKPEQKEEKDS